MRLQDEIMEVGVSLPSSPNLRDLMKEQDRDEIRSVVERPRQTMGSILSTSDQEVVGGKTLWEVIQEEEESKPKEGRVLRNVLRFRFRREESENREKEGEQTESRSEAADEEEEEIRLLESWGAAERSPRSPAVVDSARLHMQDSRLARLESAAVRVYLVGGSNPVEDQTVEGMNRRWRALKNRLRLRKFACCGSYWSSSAAGAERSSFSNMSSTSVMLPREEDDEEGEIGWNESAGGEIHPNENPSNSSISISANATENENDSGVEIDDNSVETCVSAVVTDSGAEERASTAAPRRQQLITLFGRNFEPAVAAEEEENGEEMRVGMNLAAALAAERQLRAAQEWDLTARTSTSTTTSTSPGVSNLGQPTRGTSPFRVSLMSLLEESDDRAVDTERSDNSALFSEEAAGGIGDEPLCCVCMVRRKGAAFIPCGHTFCRLCTRELWVSRGSCPLCNRYIMEILDIF